MLGLCCAVILDGGQQYPDSGSMPRVGLPYAQKTQTFNQGCYKIVGLPASATLGQK